MITTLLAWGSVYGLLLTIFWVFGPQLAALPSALRLLVVSGALVGLMANLVMPAVGRIVDRDGRPPKSGASRDDDRASSGRRVTRRPA